MGKTFGFKVRRIGKIKRAPMWGDMAVEAIREVLEEDEWVGLGRELDRIVANWENKPRFKIRTGYNYKSPGAFEGGMPFKRGDITLGYRLVGSRKSMQIWTWLNLGTKPHKIRARNAPALSFVTGGPGSYKAKTTPGGSSLKFGGPGVVSGGERVYAQEVDHPGNEPRDFDGYIQHKVETKFKRAIKLAVKLGLDRANRQQKPKRTSAGGLRTF